MWQWRQWLRPTAGSKIDLPVYNCRQSLFNVEEHNLEPGTQLYTTFLINRLDNGDGECWAAFTSTGENDAHEMAQDHIVESSLHEGSEPVHILSKRSSNGTEASMQGVSICGQLEEDSRQLDAIAEYQKLRSDRTVLGLAIREIWHDIFHVLKNPIIGGVGLFLKSVYILPTKVAAYVCSGVSMVYHAAAGMKRIIMNPKKSWNDLKKASISDIEIVKLVQSVMKSRNHAFNAIGALIFYYKRSGFWNVWELHVRRWFADYARIKSLPAYDTLKGTKMAY